MSFWKRFAIVFVCAASVMLAGRYAWEQLPSHRPPPPDPSAWKTNLLRGVFTGMQVRQLDSSNAALVFYFDLENPTGADFRLPNDSNLVVMSRLKSNGSLSAENRPHLQEGAFIPARNRTRIALFLNRSFAWPSPFDPSADAKIRDFASQCVSNLSGFVLFDQSSHFQIDLPGGWQALQSPAPPAKSP